MTGKPLTEASPVAAARRLGYTSAEALADAIIAGTVTTEMLKEAETERIAAVGKFEYVDVTPPALNSVAERAWVVFLWIALGTLTLLSGMGGIGKTLLAQLLATCITLGRPVLGGATARGAVMLFGGEDDAPEFQRRQARIDRSLGIDADNPHDGLHIVARAGMDNILATVDREGKVKPTPLFEALEAEVARIKPVLLIIDNIASSFAINENDRGQVTQASGLLTGIATRNNCAVLLLGHVAKYDGSQYSGSTAWEAACRARLWFERKEGGVLALHRAKSNYSALDSCLFEWRDGCIVEVAGSWDTASGRDAERAVLSALAMYTSEEITCSASDRAGASFLPRRMQADQRLAGVTYEGARAALSRLLSQGVLEPHVRLPWKTSNRTAADGLATAANAEVWRAAAEKAAEKVAAEKAGAADKAATAGKTGTNGDAK